MEIMVPILAIITTLIGLPWLIFHYITKWKQAPTMTGEDEQLLDELHHMARRLDERLDTIERIVAADNPDYRAQVSQTPVRGELDYTRRS
jgi:phage shock protein B